MQVVRTAPAEARFRVTAWVHTTRAQHLQWSSPEIRHGRELLQTGHREAQPPWFLKHISDQQEVFWCALRGTSMFSDVSVP